MLLGLLVDGRPRLQAATVVSTDGHSRILISPSQQGKDGDSRCSDVDQHTLRVWSPFAYAIVAPLKDRTGARSTASSPLPKTVSNGGAAFFSCGQPGYPSSMSWNKQAQPADTLEQIYELAQGIANKMEPESSRFYRRHQLRNGSPCLTVRPYSSQQRRPCFKPSPELLPEAAPFAVSSGSKVASTS